MQKIVLILYLLCLGATADAQVVFETIVKREPVAVGESFPVQFVLEDADPDQQFYPPEFDNFRFVSGPYIYSGTVEGPLGSKKLKNIVYTLEAIKPGRFKIRGGTAMVNDNLVKSDDEWIEVITRAQAEAKRSAQTGNAEYFLKPGEDPYQKMKDNLFLKVKVDKTTCFVGQPITATYKLYSRLVSKSAIVKNPGFYGFTVQDMIGVNDKKIESEVINGKKFDVHTIRKVQLYPLQAGQYTMDPMEVSNKVEFSRSIVTHRSEQEIIEGVVDDKNEPVSANAEEFENSMDTAPIFITVKARPQKNQPTEFTGATGHFSIGTVINKTELAKNEEGQLIIEITGRGNFTQLTAPVIQWPEGVEGFEPKITDTLDATASPLKGKRSFLFSFVSSKSGRYTIPAISFSFFDPDSNRYKTVSGAEQHIVINDKEKKAEQGPEMNSGHSRKRHGLLITMLGLVAIIIGSWILRLRKKRMPEPFDVPAEKVLPSVAQLLQPAAEYNGEVKGFYNTLRQCIWNVFSLHLGLTGSKMNIRDLQHALRQKQLDEKSQQAIVEILQECETGIFTDALIQTDRKTLLEKTRQSLEKIV